MFKLVLIFAVVNNDYIINKEHKNYAFRDEQTLVFVHLYKTEFFEFLR